MTERIQELGFKEIELARLRLPDNFDAIKRDPIIERLALSIKAMGLIEKPTVRLSDMRLCVGKKRVAALMWNQEQLCTVRMIECDDYTFRMLGDAGNSDRTDWEETEHGQSVTHRVKVIAENIMRLNPDMAWAGQGKRRNAHSMAIELLARELGLTAKAVHSREFRERHKKAGFTSPPRIKGGPVQEQAPGVCIALLGIDVTPLFLQQVSEVQRALDDAFHHAIYVRTAISKLLKNADLPRHQAKLRRLKAMVDDLECEIVAQRPAVICPWCKGQPGVQANCAPCHSTGYGTKTQFDGAPKKLLNPAKPLVVINGEEVPLEKALAG